MSMQFGIANIIGTRKNSETIGISSNIDKDVKKESDNENDKP